MNENLQYKVFDWLRFPLIVGVVFIHCFGKPFDITTVAYSKLSAIDCYNIFRVCISHVAAHVCVPLFFFISGYLFFTKLSEWNTETFFKKLNKRVKTLLIPFLIWNTFKIFLSVQNAYFSEGMSAVSDFFSENGYIHLYWDSHVWNIDRTNWMGECRISTSPHLVPLWYLRNLIVVMIFSPLLYLWLKHFKVFGLLVLSISYITGIEIGVPGFSSNAFFFFGAGAFFCMNKIDVTTYFSQYRYVYYAVSIILWVACSVFDGHNTKTGEYIYPFYVIFGSIAVFNFATCVVKSSKFSIPDFLSQSSFFIYLAHTVFFIRISRKIVSMVFSRSNAYILCLQYLLVPILTVILCLVSYLILKTYFPKLCGVLTGER